MHRLFYLPKLLLIYYLTVTVLNLHFLCDYLFFIESNVFWIVHHQVFNKTLDFLVEMCWHQYLLNLMEVELFFHQLKNIINWSLESHIQGSICFLENYRFDIL